MKKLCKGELLRLILLTVALMLPVLSSTTVGSCKMPIWGRVVLNLGVFMTIASIFVRIGVHRVAKLMMMPLVIIAFVYAGFVWITGYDITFHAVCGVLDTNPREAYEYIQNPPILIGIGIGVFVLGSIGYLLACKWHHPWVTKPIVVRKRLLYVCAFMGFLCLGSWSATGGDFNNIYPLRLYNFTAEHLKKLPHVKKCYANTRELYKYQGPKINDKPETYILIIGESARAQNWDLYGYHRETNPVVRSWRDKNPHNFVLFPRCVSAGRVTRVSVTSFLSTETCEHFSSFYKKPGFVHVFRKAGFKTFVASAQPENGFYGGLQNMLLKDAEITKFWKHPPMDMGLLPYLDQYLKDPAPKKLIILHINGSHYKYTARYTKDFERYTKRGTEHEELFSTYDNSLLYTDTLIGKVLERAKNHANPAMVLYTSDHGENLNDFDDKNYQHGSKSINRFEINVPMICYFNKKFTNQKANAVKNIYANRDRQLSHDVIAHTFLGLANLVDKNIYYPEFDISSKKFGPAEMYFAEKPNESINFKDLAPHIWPGPAKK